MSRSSSSAPDGRVRGIRLIDVVAVDGRFLPVEAPGSALACQARPRPAGVGFTGRSADTTPGPRRRLDGRNNVALTRQRPLWSDNGLPSVNVAGDMGRGQSLIVWAIAGAGRPQRLSTGRCPGTRCCAARFARQIAERVVGFPASASVPGGTHGGGNFTLEDPLQYGTFRQRHHAAARHRRHDHAE
jgi:NADPH-dependent glutamate synthase beta subunit-like oxidoreductase